jgi:Probable cobalt transporter subunit (CbtB)
VSPLQLREIPEGANVANIAGSSKAAGTRTGSVDLSAASAVLWLAATAFLALLALYFVGVDQGAVSLFGSDSHVHEFVHDARHLLGFPCH